jgi:lathosterol oxidase
MNFSIAKFLEILTIVGSRYFIIAGIVFMLCYFLLRNRIAAQKIQLVFPKNADYLREMVYSFSSMLIFAVIVTGVVFNPAVRPHTTIYEDK